MIDKVCWLLTSDRLVEGTPKLANFASIFHLLLGLSGINFNIGDFSNDGYEGDRGDSSRAAEVHNKN